MDDAYRCCTLPKMRMCARTSNIKKTNTDTDLRRTERKVGHRGCAEIIRYRRRGDLPWATGGGTAEGCSASSVVGLRDFVLVVLATAEQDLIT